MNYCLSILFSVTVLGLSSAAHAQSEEEVTFERGLVMARADAPLPVSEQVLTRARLEVGFINYILGTQPSPDGSMLLTLRRHSNLTGPELCRERYKVRGDKRRDGTRYSAYDFTYQCVGEFKIDKRTNQWIERVKTVTIYECYGPTRICQEIAGK
jgi:hypothetical protein